MVAERGAKDRLGPLGAESEPQRSHGQRPEAPPFAGSEQQRRSEELHSRVRRFALAQAPSEDFAAVAFDIAEYQGRYNARYQRLQAHFRSVTGAALSGLVEGIAPVPSDAFRAAPVFAFDRALAVRGFRSSGTTAQRAAVHWMRTTSTYEVVALEWGRRALLDQLPASSPSPIVVALAPWTGLDTPSSLGFMMQRFMEAFDGCSLDTRRSRAQFELSAAERWLIRDECVDFDGLAKVTALAHACSCPVVLLATSFALVGLFDAASGQRLELPAGSVVMQTGGYKGRSRELSTSEMAEQIAKTFGSVTVVNEYGMTELSSQLYDACSLGARTAGEYVEPPWLRVILRDPVTLLPVEPGNAGLLSFVDLANVDSAVAILTQDWGVREGRGVRLLGRMAGAELRGCSLDIEALLAGGGA